MKFVIVGGGVSGWLSTLIFSHRQSLHEYHIIESSDVNTIGVGEGTTGFFMNIIDNISTISIEEFLKEFTSKKAMSNRGYLAEIGLVPLASDKYKVTRTAAVDLNTIKLK